MIITITNNNNKNKNNNNNNNNKSANKTKHKLGVDGWDAQITNSKEVEKLRKHGVPYEKGEKPKVWVFDWQIIKKC